MTLPPIPEATRLDRVIAAFAPGWAAKRHHARCQLAFSGGYSGGGYTGAKRDRKALKNWDTPRGSADAVTLGDLPSLRDASYELARNNPIAVGARSRTISGTVGTGLWPRPRLNARFLGLTDEQASEWAERHDLLWYAWAESRNSDVSRRFTFARLQRLAFGAMLDGGDALAIRRQARYRGELFSTRVQMVEGALISNPNDAPDSPEITAGIERDPSTGAHIAFHVRSSYPGRDYVFGAQLPTWSRVPAFGDKTGMPLALHLMDPDRPGATRGVPFYAPIVEAIRQLGTFSDAAIDAAVTNAFFTVFITSPDGEDAISGDKGAEDEENREITMGPGRVHGLLPGEDIKVADSKHPNPNFAGFLEAYCQIIGAALDIPYEVLMQHFTSSYTASRGALLQFWRRIRERRFFFGTDFCGGVREWVMYEWVAMGLLDCPGFLTDPLRRMAWLECDWVGDGPGALDPVKEATAAKLRMDIQQTTLDKETLEYDGGDWRRNVAQAGVERQARIAAGVTTEMVAERVSVEPMEPKPAELDGGSAGADEPDEDTEKEEDEEDA